MEFSLAILFSIPIVLIVANAYRKAKERDYVHKERMMAMERGLPIPVELQETPPPNEEENAEARIESSSRSYGLHGVIWTAIGAGLMAVALGFSKTMDSSDMREFAQFLGIWGIPALLVGIGLLLYGWFTGLGRLLNRGGRHVRRRHDASTSPESENVG